MAALPVLMSTAGVAACMLSRAGPSLQPYPARAPEAARVSASSAVTSAPWLASSPSTCAMALSAASTAAASASGPGREAAEALAVAPSVTLNAPAACALPRCPVSSELADDRLRTALPTARGLPDATAASTSPPRASMSSAVTGAAAACTLTAAVEQACASLRSAAGEREGSSWMGGILLDDATADMG